MRKLIIIFIGLLIASICSCRKDFSTTKNFGNLSFSKDTVYLDTIFSKISSPTYSLKVYNKGNQTISIPKIHLQNGESSFYRINIDGIAGRTFEDVEILENDSIYIFIETTIDASKIKNPLYTDKLVFNNGIKNQHVDIVTLVKDAIFIYPNKDLNTLKVDSLTLNNKITSIKGRFLKDDELTFTSEKPYVIYGYAAVPSNKTLTIEKGSNLYFHEDSGIIVDKDATLKVNGTLKEKVTFQGDRLEHFFDDVSGQWGTIWLRAGSKKNEIENAVIKNAVIGVIADSIADKTEPNLKIENSEIYNSRTYGLYGRQTNITGNNLVIGNSGESAISAILGGSYNFTHCTLANYSNTNIRTSATVNIQSHDYELRDAAPTNINFTNCIIDGTNNTEFILHNIDNTPFEYTIKNCMLKIDSKNTDNLLDTKNKDHYQNNILNGVTDFKESIKNNFTIGAKNEGINKGTPSDFKLDLLGKNREIAPDIGAYQHIIFE